MRGENSLIKVLNTDSDEWNEYINKLPLHLKDIYFKSEYYSLYEKCNDGLGTLFVYEEENNLAIYPFLINVIERYELNKNYYDIETAYGYGGPIVNTNDRVFINNFEKAFKDYCNKNNIIAEFIRFHPLLNNHKIFKDNIEIIHNRTTTFIDLNKTIEEIWNDDIISKNRNVIRKAERSGLTVNLDSNLNDFKQVYQITMNKVNASKKYYFNEEYFDHLNKVEHICISVNKDNVTIASAIFLKYKDFFHYHLAGSLKEYLKYSPNNLLLWSAIKYAKDNKFAKFHFGGGLTDSLSDNLYKFKKSFCKNTADFYIGKRIHNKEIYDYLINTWECSNKTKSDIFLKYKLSHK